MPEWFTVLANGVRLGKVYCTEAELRRAAGAWHTLEKGVCIIYAPPR